MGGTLQMLLGMLPVLGPLREAFRSGKGVAPATYPDDAWEGMERDMAGMYEHKLVAEWLPRVPAVRALLEKGVDVADIGCGRGRALFALAKAFPRSRYVGYDAHAPNVAKGSKRAAEAGLADRVRFEARRASQGLPPMDLALTFGVGPHAARPLDPASALRRAPRNGGRWRAC